MKKRGKIWCAILGIILLAIIDGLLFGNDKMSINQYTGHGQEIHSVVVSEQPEGFLESVNDTAPEFIPCVVSRNIDGDTICVTGDFFDDETKIRFIGVNTPECVSPEPEENCEEGIAASEFTSEYLKPGTEIYLEFDEDRSDAYGRTLAYVWLSGDVDTASYTDFCAYNYGAILLQNTYCEAAYYAPNGKYRQWYEQLEKECQ